MSSIVAEKLEQTTGILNELGADTWLTFVRETGDFCDPVLPLILGQNLTWQSALIVTRSGERIAIVGNFEEDAVKSLGIWTEVIPYVKSIREVLVETLDRIRPAKIAVNYSADDVKADGLTHGMYLLLRRHLEGTPHQERLVSAGDIINALRGRKTRGELDLIRTAIEQAEAIFDEAGRVASIGKTEEAVANLMQEQTRERGLDLAWDPHGCPIVNTGPESMVGHGLPSQLTIEPGHLFHIDFGVRYEGFCSDLQRMWYVPREGESEPPESVQHAFDTVVKAIQKSAAAIRPGVAGWEIDAIAREAVTAAGYPEFQHGLGHSVGRSAHDGGTGLLPRWEKYGQTPYGKLEVGNVFTVEPSIQDVDGHGCLGLEEMVVVTDRGCEFLSSPQTTLRLLK